MKVWTTTRFSGLWPVGTSAVVVAETKEQAAQLLSAELEFIGLPQEVSPDDLTRLDTKTPNVLILNDGNY